MISAIVSNKIDDHSVAVYIEDVKKHPVYGKVIRIKKKILCHVENINLKCGDKVFIKGSRPFSKKKKHIVVEVVK